jgi:transposase
VRDYPDAYQSERAKRPGVSEKGIGHALRRMSITYKKTLKHPKTSDAARHILEFLPVYSPDLNPIENKWAHLKALRRKLLCPIVDLFKIESFYLT